MSTLQDPLAKPVWPVVSAEIEEQAVAMLCGAVAPLNAIKDPAAVPDLFASLTLGFNSTMAAIEQHFDGGAPLEAIFVCRSDLAPMIYQPFALASAAGQIRLVALPKGSADRLAKTAGRDASVIGIRAGADRLVQLVQPVGCAQADWAYAPATLKPRKPAPKGPKAPKTKST